MSTHRINKKTISAKSRLTPISAFTRAGHLIRASVAPKKALALAVASVLTTWASIAGAEEAVIYVAGAKADELSLKINDTLYFFDKSSVAVMDLEPGKYKAEISVKDQSIGTITFELLANNYAEIKVRIDSNNKMLSKKSKFDPAADVATGQLIGRIFGTGGESELAGATVKVHGEKYSTTTILDGSYSLTIPRGVYTIEVSHPKHISRIIEDVRIISDVATEASLSLPIEEARSNPSAVMEETIVMGVVGALDESSLAIERDASSVVEAISAEDFKKFGDSSASDALKRVTGVSVVGGQFAVVRGLAGRYISTTLNGGMLPSTDTLRRDVPLDLFPSGVLDGIDISKSFTAELPADSTGGHVGMRLKEVPRDKVNKLSAGLEYVSVATGKDLITYQGGGNDWLGMDDGTREMPDLLSSNTDNGKNNLPDACVDGIAIPNCINKSELNNIGKSLPNNMGTNYEKAAPNQSLGYAFGDSYGVTGGELGFYAAVDYKQKWKNYDDATIIDKDVSGSPTGDLELTESTTYERSQHLVDLTGYLAAEYETDAGHSFKSKTVILRKTSDTARASSLNDVADPALSKDSTRLSWVERQMFYQGISGDHLLTSDEANKVDWTVMYAKTNRDEPDTRSYEYSANGEFSPSNQRTYADLSETAKGININLTMDRDSFWDSMVNYKVGISGFEKDRESFKSRFNYRGTGVDVTLPVDEIISPESFDNNLVVLQYATDANDWYTASEQGHAFYAQGEWSFNDEWIVNIGARAESFEQEVDYPSPSSTATPVPVRKNDDVLPALNVTWRASDAWQWRAALSQTISRPGIVEINSSSQIDPDTDKLIVGNSDLIQSDISNLDVKGEFYFGDEEKITLGVFYKTIDNPIEKSIRAGLDVNQGYTFRNSDEATLLGLEFEFEKYVAEFYGWNNKVAGNLSWIDSEVKLDSLAVQLEGRNKRSLQGQSEFLGNLQYSMIHEDTGQTLTFLVNYFDDRIDVVNTKANGDRMELGRLKFDIVYAYEMENGLTLNGKIEDLTDEKIIYSASGDTHFTEESYYFGRKISLGLAYDF